MIKRHLHWLGWLFFIGAISAQAPVTDEKGTLPETSKPSTVGSVAPSFEVSAPNSSKPTDSPADVAGKKYRVHGYLTIGLPVSSISDYVKPTYGIRGSISRKLKYPWLHPLVIADTFYSGGKGISGMWFYYSGLGLTYPVRIPKQVIISPFATVGMSGGRLYYQDGYDFFLPAIDTGVSADYPITDKWRVAAALSFRHTFDKFVPGSFIQLHFGVNHVF